MRIGLIDVDGHNFPNLALMRLSAFHKAQGDSVEWWWSDLEHYDIVYMSKVFSDTYSKDKPMPFNADKVIRGGRVMPSPPLMARKSMTSQRTGICRKRLSGCFPTTPSIRSTIMR